MIVVLCCSSINLSLGALRTADTTVLVDVYESTAVVPGIIQYAATL